MEGMGVNGKREGRRMKDDENTGYRRIPAALFSFQRPCSILLPFNFRGGLARYGNLR